MVGMPYLNGCYSDYLGASLGFCSLEIYLFTSLLILHNNVITDLSSSRMFTPKIG